MPHGTEQIIYKGAKGEVALGRFLSELDESLAWYQNAVFTGLTLKKQSNGFLVVLRADVKGKPKVAFYGGDELLDVYRKLWLFIVNYSVDWKDDKYSKR